MLTDVEIAQSAKMKPIKEIEQLEEDYDYVNENREKIIERFTNLLVEAGN